jgi:hypothetical protein
MAIGACASSAGDAEEEEPLESIDTVQAAWEQLQLAIDGLETVSLAAPGRLQPVRTSSTGDSAAMAYGGSILWRRSSTGSVAGVWLRP